MKIGINLLSLVPGKIGGMEQYVRNLISYSLHASDNDELFLFLNSQNIDTFTENHRKLHKIPIHEMIDRNRQLSLWIHSLKLDVWFCPLLISEPALINVPCVVTISDIQHEFFPEFFDSNILAWRDKFYEHSINTCKAVLTISEYSKKPLLINIKFRKIKCMPSI